jgi:uncharacterized membrane protein
LWVCVLFYLSLSHVFTFYALVFVFVPIISYQVFDEGVFDVKFSIGTSLIICGVILANV